MCFDFVKRLSLWSIQFGSIGMIKVKVPELMSSKGWSVSDLMRKANLAYKTAHRLSKGMGDSISFDVLNSLCEVFDVQVKDILEYVADKK
jgi:DNA-binding Xre family transcriptional regulator